MQLRGTNSDTQAWISYIHAAHRLIHIAVVVHRRKLIRYLSSVGFVKASKLYPGANSAVNLFTFDVLSKASRPSFVRKWLSHL